MTKTIPSYLRIHRGAKHRNIIPARPGSDSIDQFWNAYTEATGWRIDPATVRRKATLDILPAVRLCPMNGVDDLGDLAAVGRSSAMRLAESASRLADQLQQSSEALRRQEAELAARASLVTGAPSQMQLADQLQMTLDEAAAACSCDAAAMYMLDDDTRTLKARAVLGLPEDRLAAPPNDLRGSRGDLEALVKGVVAIDAFAHDGIDLWCPPEPFAAGICASINQADIPIGTLWLFSNEARQFGSAESAAARLAASQLASQLSIASHGGNQHQSTQTEVAVRELAQWQLQGLPIGSQLAPGWRVDGTIESPQDWAIGWHTWDVLPDGSLMLAIAEAVDRSVNGAMTATVARAALAAHTGYRHTPVQLMQRISDTLWQTNMGDQLVSILYVRVDPETGEGEVASAGDITAMIASGYGYRPLVDGRGQPLTTSIDANVVCETFRMMPGETLLAYGQGIERDGGTQTSLGDCVRTCMQRGDRNPLAAVRRELADQPLQHERGAVTLVRESL